MQWLQHNLVWIALVLAIIVIFFIISRLTKNATIHDETTRHKTNKNSAIPEENYSSLRPDPTVDSSLTPTSTSTTITDIPVSSPIKPPKDSDIRNPYK